MRKINFDFRHDSRRLPWTKLRKTWHRLSQFPWDSRNKIQLQGSKVQRILRRSRYELSSVALLWSERWTSWFLMSEWNNFFTGCADVWLVNYCLFHFDCRQLIKRFVILKRWFNVKCATTAQLYVLNERLYKYILPFTPKFPEDYDGPLVDK